MKLAAIILTRYAMTVGSCNERPLKPLGGHSSPTYVRTLALFKLYLSWATFIEAHLAYNPPL